MIEYLVVTMQQARLSLILRLLPCSFFKCQALPYSIRSFQAVVPNKSIYRTVLARFDPRTTLAFAFVEACGPNYAFTKLRVHRPSTPYRNHALQPMQL